MDINLTTSQGNTYTVTLPDDAPIASLEDLRFRDVTNSIVRPSAEDRGEALLALLSLDRIRTDIAAESLSNAQTALGAVEAFREQLENQIDEERADAQFGTYVGLGLTALALAATVLVPGAGLLAAVAVGAGGLGTMASLAANRIQQDADGAILSIFDDILASLENSIAELDQQMTLADQVLTRLENGQSLSTVDVQNAAVGIYDSTETVFSIVGLLGDTAREIEAVYGPTPALDAFKVALDALSFTGSAIAFGGELTKVADGQDIIADALLLLAGPLAKLEEEASLATEIASELNLHPNVISYLEGEEARLFAKTQERLGTLAQVEQTIESGLDTAGQVLDPNLAANIGKGLTYAGIGGSIAGTGLAAWQAYSSVQKADAAEAYLTGFLTEMDRINEVRLSFAMAQSDQLPAARELADILPLIGTDDPEFIYGSELGDLILGKGDDDDLYGEDGDDTLLGGDGADQIFGGAGNDLIIGGLGTDTLIGGEGRDTYVGVLAELQGDDFELLLGDRIELVVGSDPFPATSNVDVQVDGDDVTIDFDGNGSVDFSFTADVPNETMIVVESDAMRPGAGRVIALRVGDEAGFAVNQALSSGLRSQGVAELGGIATNGQVFQIGSTQIADISNPEIRNLAVTPDGRVFTLLEYDSAENLSFAGFPLPPVFFDDAQLALVELDPGDGAFIGPPIEVTESFGAPESINALTALPGGGFLAVAEFPPGPSFDFLRTLEGGSDFVFRIGMNGDTQFLQNWGDGQGTRTVSADTHPITGTVYAWEDYSNLNNFGNGRLYTVDPSDGDRQLVGNFSGIEIRSIAFEADGTLLGVGINQFNQAVYARFDFLTNSLVQEGFVSGAYLPREWDLYGDLNFQPLETGSEGPDETEATDASEDISTGGGDDVIDARGGNDEIDPGKGDDTILPGEGNDTVNVGDGGDDVRGTPSALNGDTIRNFGPDDCITLLGTDISGAAGQFDPGDYRVFLDTTNDGNIDVSFRLLGDFGDPGLVFDRDDQGNTCIRLTPVREDPVAQDDQANVPVNSASLVDLFANDTPNGALLTEFAGQAVAADGITTITLQSGATVYASQAGAVVYDPTEAFLALADGAAGGDTVSYTITRDDQATATAQVEFAVTGLNDAPIAAADTATTEVGAAITVDVLANDSDPEGTALSLVSVATPQEGTATLSSDGRVNYAPDPGFEGLDLVEYVVADAEGLEAIGLLAVYVGSDGSDVTFGGVLPDEIVASAPGALLYGLDGSDRLEGASGNELLSGGRGNDTLTGGVGDDTLLGGDGSDTADYRTRAQSLTVRLDEILPQAISGDETDVLSSIENVFAGSLADNITGSDANNVLHGFAGDDILSGENGDDTLEGGTGDDSILGGRGADSLDGGDGDDTMSGGVGDDLLTGAAGADFMRGGIGEDALFGGAADDNLRGQRNADLLDGGDGHDNVKGGGGNDTLLGGDGDDFLNGGTRADIIEGGDGNDNLIGRAFSDTLIGDQGDDRLNSGGGADRLEGGVGRDTIKGGQGADVFVFDLGFEIDRLIDFDILVDRLEITSALAAGRDAAEIAALASPRTQGFEIDFGNGDVIELTALATTAGLAGQIDIV